MAKNDLLDGAFTAATSPMEALRTAWNNDANAEINKILQTLQKNGVKVTPEFGGASRQYISFGISNGRDAITLNFTLPAKGGVEYYFSGNQTISSANAAKTILLGEIAKFRGGEDLLMKVQRELEGRSAKADSRPSKPA